MIVEDMFSGAAIIAIVLAMNVYKKFSNGWLMNEHHASLIQNQSRSQTLQSVSP